MKLRFVLLALVSAVALRAAESPLVFNAILTIGKEHRFVLVNAAGKASSFLKIGESFDGYAIKSYDAKESTLEVEREGKKHKLTLVTDAAVQNATAASAPATLADATAVLNAMNFEQMMDRTMAGAKKTQIAMVEKMMGQMAGPGADREAALELQKKVMDVMMSAVSGAELKDDVAKIYSEVFTQEELQGLTNFYASPMGQSFADKQPVITQKINEIIAPRMMAVMPKVQQMAREFGEAQKAKREAAPAAPKQ